MLGLTPLQPHRGSTLRDRSGPRRETRSSSAGFAAAQAGEGSFPGNPLDGNLGPQHAGNPELAAALQAGGRSALRCSCPNLKLMSLSITAVNPRSESRGSQYRPEIDGLRALALLAVIAHHFNSSLLPGGYLGVDIFFVISGLLFLGNGGKAAEKQRLASSMFSDRAMDQHVVAANRKSEKILSSCNITPFLLGNGSKYSLGPVDEGFLKQCIRPAGESQETKPNLVVVGDSFAEKLMPHAALAAVKSGFSFGGVYGYGCAYGLRSGLILHPSFPRCRYINEDLLENALFDALNPGDVVLLRYHLPNKSYVRYPTGHSQPSPSAYDKAITAFLAKASSRGARVILIGPNPTLSTQEMMALRPEWFNAWNRKQQIDINNGQLSLYFDQLDTHLQHISKTWGPHRYLSLRPFICATEKSCTMAKGNKFLYSDDHHLSPYGHDLFFGTLMADINPGRGKSSLDAKSMSSHGNRQ